MEESAATVNDHDPVGRQMLARLSGTRTTFLLRCLLGGLFFYAGVTKAMNPDAFVVSLEKYQFLPEFLIAPLAIYLPFLEILTGISLITGIFYGGGLFLTKGMLLAFSLGLALAWCRGLDITCGCFGNEMGDWPAPWALLRNLVLFSFSVVLAFTFFRNQRRSLAQIPELFRSR